MNGTLRQRDTWAGLLLVVLGAGVAVNGWALSMGTLAEIGPGFFPTVLGAILLLIGLAVALGRGEAEEAVPLPDWRGVGAIVAGLLAFVGLGARAGLIPGTFALVFIAAMGDRTTRWRQALVLAAAITVVAVAVFHYGLQVQFPLLGGR